MHRSNHLPACATRKHPLERLVKALEGDPKGDVGGDANHRQALAVGFRDSFRRPPGLDARSVALTGEIDVALRNATGLMDDLVGFEAGGMESLTAKIAARAALRTLVADTVLPKIVEFDRLAFPKGVTG